MLCGDLDVVEVCVETGGGRGGRFQEDIVYIQLCFPLLYSKNQHNIVRPLYPNKKQKHL